MSTWRIAGTSRVFTAPQQLCFAATPTHPTDRDLMTTPAVHDLVLSFFGGTGTVTGSRYLATWNSRNVLVDCGLFQGYKQLRLKNWARPPFDAAGLDAVVLTHAHIDHSGYIPVLAKLGFRGRVYATSATFELCRILLPDSGFLQEEQARFENRHGCSKHQPALPLYTREDAERSLELFATVRLGKEFEPVAGIAAELSRAGHVLGASSVRLRTA